MGDRSYALSGGPMLNRSAEEHLLDDLVDLLPGAAAIILLTLITSFQTASRRRAAPADGGAEHSLDSWGSMGLWASPDPDEAPCARGVACRQAALTVFT